MATAEFSRFAGILRAAMICVQVGVVVIKRSGDIEPDLDDDVLS